jgi:hypothetical protein
VEEVVMVKVLESGQVIGFDTQMQYEGGASGGAQMGHVAPVPPPAPPAPPAAPATAIAAPAPAAIAQPTVEDKTQGFWSQRTPWFFVGGIVGSLLTVGGFLLFGGKKPTDALEPGNNIAKK